jgi:phospholipid/cholesterol/gamma-HCH transport system substrate-binding protein
VAAFIVFLWASFHVPGPGLLSNKHTCRAYFADVGGMVNGAPVRLGGVPVGTVSKISFDQFGRRHQVELELRIQNEHWRFLHNDASASLGTVGVLGDIVVNLQPGSDGAPPLHDDQEIRAVEVTKLTDLAPNVAEALKDVQRTTRDISLLTQKLTTGEGTLGQLLTSPALHTSLLEFTNSGTQTARHIDRTQAVLARRFIRLSTQLDSLMALTQSPDGTTGRLLRDRTLYDTAVRTVTRLDSLTAALSDTGGGSAGELLRRRELYERASSTIAAVESLIAEVERHPNRFFKFSVF